RGSGSTDCPFLLGTLGGPLVQGCLDVVVTFGDRSADDPLVAEWVADPSLACPVGLVSHLEDQFGTTVERRGHDGVRVVTLDVEDHPTGPARGTPIKLVGILELEDIAARQSELGEDHGLAHGVTLVQRCSQHLAVELDRTVSTVHNELWSHSYLVHRPHANVLVGSRPLSTAPPETALPGLLAPHLRVRCRCPLWPARGDVGAVLPQPPDWRPHRALHLTRRRKPTPRPVPRNQLARSPRGDGGRASTPPGDTH